MSRRGPGRGDGADLNALTEPDDCFHYSIIITKSTFSCALCACSDNDINIDESVFLCIFTLLYTDKN